MKRNLKLYWHTRPANGRQNLGDWLSPLLCERLSGSPVVYAGPRACDLMAAGSILRDAKRFLFGRRIHVWGTGFMKEHHRLGGHHWFHAVRGRKTAERISGQSVSVWGDPGLLCDRLFSIPRRGKRYGVGLIPHYVDQRHPLIQGFLSRTPRAAMFDILLDDAPRDIPAFLERLSQCEVVLSSSLHGLVISDSLGIPNAWIRLSDRIVGKDFKYHDYYSAFGMENPRPFRLTPSTTEREVLDLAADYRREGIEGLKEGLLRSFPFRKSCSA